MANRKRVTRPPERRPQISGRKNEVELIELASPASISGLGIEIRIGPDVTIQAPRGFDPQELGTVIDLIIERC